MKNKRKGQAVAVGTAEMEQTLNLSASQIEIALKESDRSVTELISAITSMACCVQSIGENIEVLRQMPNSGEVADAIADKCRRADADMCQVVTAIQFYDRLSQRFMHIHENLHDAAVVLKEPASLGVSKLQRQHEKVRSVYSLEQQQNMQHSEKNEFTASKTDRQLEQGKAEVFGDIELF